VRFRPTVARTPAGLEVRFCSRCRRFRSSRLSMGWRIWPGGVALSDAVLVFCSPACLQVNLRLRSEFGLQVCGGEAQAVRMARTAVFAKRHHFCALFWHARASYSIQKPSPML